MSIFKKKKDSNRVRSKSTPRASMITFSYHSKRSEKNNSSARNNQSNNLQTKRITKLKFKYLPLLLLLMTIFSGVIYLSTINPNVRVKVIVDKNTSELRKTSEYQKSANDFIARSVVNRSKLLFDSSGLSEYLRGKFPELATVSVSVPIINRRPVIHLSVTKPSFILISGSQSYIIGNNGIALIKVKQASNGFINQIPTVVDESGIEVSAGKMALPTEQAVFISIIIEQLNAANKQVESLLIPKSPYDLHIRLKNHKYFIKFNLLEDPKQQVGSLLAVQQKLSQDHNIVPNQYIDVRVGERVFYK